MLLPAHLHAMDGGNSVKRFSAAGHADEQQFYSPYYILRDQVDAFKDDVTLRPGTRSNSQADQSHMDNGQNPIACTDNWKMAKTVSRDSVKVFDQTGIFICACRHGLVELFCEMYRSREL